MKTPHKRNDCGIYCFIHRDSGLVYVGSSNKIGKRLIEHIRFAKIGRHSQFYSALRKFTIDAFDFEIIEQCKKEHILEREEFWISFYRAAGCGGFNTYSKPASIRYDWQHSLATRKKIILKNTGRKHSLETRIKMSASRKKFPGCQIHMQRMIQGNIGRKRSIESIRKTAEANRGRQWTKEQRSKASESRKLFLDREKASGIKRRHSKETLRKIGLALRGRIVSDETRAKLSANLKGRKMSDEARRKMSASHKGIVMSKEAVEKRVAALRLTNDKKRNLGIPIMSLDQIKKMAEGRKGKKQSPEHIAKCVAGRKFRRETLNRAFDAVGEQTK